MLQVFSFTKTGLSINMLKVSTQLRPYVPLGMKRMSVSSKMFHFV